MANPADVIDLNVSLANGAPVPAGDTSTMVIVDFNARFPERMRKYARTEDMLTDGFVAGDAAYRAALQIEKQGRRPKEWYVARRISAPDLEYNLVPVPQANTAYAVEVITPAGAVQTVSFTSGASPTVANIVTGLNTAFTTAAIAGLVASDQATFLRIKASVAGTWFSVRAIAPSILTLGQVQLAPGLLADLNAILAFRRDWSQFAMTTSSPAEALIAASFAEANKRFYDVDLAQSDVRTVATTDVASQLKALNYNRTHMRHTFRDGDLPAFAVAGYFFGTRPGEAMMANLPIKGVTPDDFSASEIANLKLKNVNYYSPYSFQRNSNGEIALERNGVQASGFYTDTIRDLDALDQEMTLEILNVFTSNLKVPYNEAGLSLVLAAISKTLARNQTNGVLDPETPYTVSAPLVVDMSLAARNARRFEGITFTARMSSGVLSVKVNGRVEF